MDGTFPDMFRRHRSDPDPTIAASFSDRLEAIARLPRATGAHVDERPMRARLAASTAVGLRTRLSQPVAASTRG
jgi:hypothetical protein